MVETKERKSKQLKKREKAAMQMTPLEYSIVMAKSEEKASKRPQSCVIPGTWISEVALLNKKLKLHDQLAAVHEMQNVNRVSLHLPQWIYDRLDKKRVSVDRVSRGFMKHYDERLHQEKVLLLRWCKLQPFLGQFTLEVLEEFIKRMRGIKRKKGQVIYMDGDPLDNIYFVTAGKVKLRKFGIMPSFARGRPTEETQRYCGPGDMFGLEEVRWPQSPTTDEELKKVERQWQAVVKKSASIVELSIFDAVRVFDRVRMKLEMCRYAFMKEHTLLKAYPDDILKRICDVSLIDLRAQGETLISMEDDAQVLFIKKGEVKLLQTVPVSRRNRWPEGFQRWSERIVQTMEDVEFGRVYGGKDGDIGFENVRDYQSSECRCMKYKVEAVSEKVEFIRIEHDFFYLFMLANEEFAERYSKMKEGNLHKKVKTAIKEQILDNAGSFRNAHGIVVRTCPAKIRKSDMTEGLRRSRSFFTTGLNRAQISLKKSSSTRSLYSKVKAASGVSDKAMVQKGYRPLTMESMTTLDIPARIKS